MKKLMAIALAMLLSFAVSIQALASELTSCAVTAASVAGAPGEEVAVEIRITDNPGFTNFAIALDYDRDHLTLKSIETADGETPYLCGAHASANTAWQDRGFLAAASAEAVKEDGILFTAVFEIAPGFVGEAQVTPVVQYIRNNEAVFSVFEEIQALATPGAVASVLAGDLNGDGITEYNDVMLAYKAYLGEAELTEAQMAQVDTNENGTIEEEEYQAVYQIYTGG